MMQVRAENFKCVHQSSYGIERGRKNPTSIGQSCTLLGNGKPDLVYFWSYVLLKSLYKVNTANHGRKLQIGASIRTPNRKRYKKSNFDRPQLYFTGTFLLKTGLSFFPTDIFLKSPYSVNTASTGRKLLMGASILIRNRTG